MKKGRFESSASAKKHTKKVVALLLVMLLLVGSVVGTTLAWLTAQTESIENVFTVGNIAIDLDETTSVYKMTPGAEITKDPLITVTKGSEDCFVYVELVEANDDVNNWVTWSAAAGWTRLGTSNIYFQEVESLAAANDIELQVLANNKVYISDEMTKAYVDGITNKTIAAPTLTVTGYAVQQNGFADAYAAWNETFGKSSPIEKPAP